MSEVARFLPPGRYGLRQLARSEIAKVATLRSTAIAAALTAVGTLLVTGLVTRAALHQTPDYYIGFDPTRESLTGMIVAALTAGVFGTLLITGEYSSGTIRATLAAAPRRPLLLATKVVVTALLTVVFFEVLSLVSFFLGQAILSGGGAPSADLASPGAARAVLFTGLFIALIALMSFGFGIIFRSTAAGIAAFVGVVFVLPLVMHGISRSTVRYLPTSLLTDSVMSAHGPRGVDQSPSPAVGLLLMTLYAAFTLVVGAVLFVRRDA